MNETCSANVPHALKQGNKRSKSKWNSNLFFPSQSKLSESLTEKNYLLKILKRKRVVYSRRIKKNNQTTLPDWHVINGLGVAADICITSWDQIAVSKCI